MVKLSDCCHGDVDSGLNDHLSRPEVLFNVTDRKMHKNNCIENE